MNWPKLPISEVCSNVVDCVNRTAPIVDYETPYKMLRTTNVRGGFVDTKNVRCVTLETYERWTRRLVPERGDVFLTREAPLGDVGRLTTDETVFLGQRLFHYRVNPMLMDARFLAYVLQSPSVQGWIKGVGMGATVEHARVGDFHKIPIPTPPLDAQAKIGEILSAYDDLIENNRRRIALLEDAARMLYREWFVYFRFPGHEHVKIINGIPEGWERRVLDQVVSVVSETVKPADFKEDHVHIGLEHIPRRSFTLADWEPIDGLASHKIRFVKGDILFGKIRPYFHKVGFAIRDGLASSDALIWRVREADDWPLVVCATSSDHFVAVASKTVREGSKMPRADWGVLKNYVVPGPPDGLLSVFNETILSITQQCGTLALGNRALAQARDLLLPRLMNGKIAV